MAPKEDALDEIQWRSPQAAQWMGGIHENTVMHYFAESPFFDLQSNNHLLRTQAAANSAQAYVLETRDAFESALKLRRGLEFIVAYGPKDFGPEAHIGEGRWVVRKQERTSPTDAKILTTYYVIGENIYQAPAADNIIWNRMLAVTTNMQKILSKASSLPIFTAASGHTYLPATIDTSDTQTKSGSLRGSRAGSPITAQDREASTEPTSQGSLDATKTSNRDLTSATDTQALYESFHRFIRHRDEYIDENPLVGEPGSFVLSSSKQHLQAQAAAQKAAELKVKVDPVKAGATPTISRPDTPSQILSKPEVKVADAGPVALPKPRRRKSKAPTSPTTPLSASTSTV